MLPAMTAPASETTAARLDALGATLYVAGLLGIATLVNFGLGAHIAEADRVMLYLVAVMVVAYRTSGGVAVLAALAAVAAYDFFFTEPRYTLIVSNARHLLTFAVMAGVGIAIASLTERLRRKTREAMAQALAIETAQMRNAMLSSVSHDLRTPLGTLMGASTALCDGAIDPGSPHARTLLRTIRDESDRLDHQLSNLLQMTRIQGGALRLDLDWHVPEELFGQALDRCRIRLADRRVDVEVDPQPALVRVDALGVDLVLANLLENAAKYADPAAPLTLRSTAEGGAWRIDVLDRGPGLPPGDPARLFEAFVRGDGVRAPGVGLGLAICDAVVRMHGGAITAGDRPGGGAVFTVRLPIGDPPASSAPEEPESLDAPAPSGVPSGR